MSADNRGFRLNVGKSWWMIVFGSILTTLKVFGLVTLLLEKRLKTKIKPIYNVKLISCIFAQNHFTSKKYTNTNFLDYHLVSLVTQNIIVLLIQ